MADALVLEASGENRVGSSPSPRITYIMNLIKYLIAWLPVRILYGLGHLTSLTLQLESIDLYWLYSWFMVKSSDIDEWGNTNYWKHTAVDNKQNK